MASSNAGGMRRKSPPRHSRESGNPFAKTLNSYPFVLSGAQSKDALSHRERRFNPGSLARM